MDEGSVASLEQPPVWYQPTQKEIELQSNETSRLQRIQGSPRVWFVDVAGAGAGIFKVKHLDIKGERKIISDSENERAAYLISHIVGFDFVPATVLREIQGEEGALQEFIEDAYLADEVESLDDYQDGLYKFWLFRHILRNPEGRDDNLLVADGKVYSIDHEASFDSDTPDPEYYDQEYRTYYGIDAPADLVGVFRDYSTDTGRKETLRRFLGEIISEDNTEQTMRRLEVIGKLLISNGRIQDKEQLRI